ncbi:D-arginine dehydrogenase [Rubricella aquisinus]|uniref:D-arginine dehydrogenase n=1 Tax=Rubricella aquisinus TaxID=2028108 RepID=A0A840X597_9RHOB|nr:FAD-binding oxidoreductase [Rubricella aquisinus]MBB5516966.1 D-arginine dehydrogenase [Rubricella aquisinus]
MRVDVAIIGAGIAGASLAAALAGHRSVLLLEREDAPGRHSTGRSAAIFVRNYGKPVLRALNDLSFGPLSEGGYLSPRGVMTIATRDDRPAFDAFMAEAHGVEQITTEEACAAFPLLRPEAANRAAIERAASDIDVDRLMQDHLRAHRAAGGEVWTKAEVTALTHDGRWQISLADGRACSAGTVVNAAGAWADEVARGAHVRPMGIIPYRRSAAILPVEQDIATWPMILPATETWYAKPEAGRLMVSPADEDPVPPQDAWPEDMVIAEGLDRFSQAVDYEITRVTHSWAGLRSFAPDHVPVAGEAPDAPGFYWLAGQGGYGVQTSPALAAHMAALIRGEASPCPDWVENSLSPRRFA